MKNWRFWLAYGILALVAALGIAAAYLWWLADPAEAPQRAELARVERATLTTRLMAIGEVAAPDEMPLTFAVAGRIREVAVAEAASVRAGDVIARLETADLELAVQQAEQGLAAANARLALAQRGPTQADLAAAQAAGDAAQARLEQAQASSVQADIQAAEARLTSARATLALLQSGPTATDLERAQLKVVQARNSLWSAQATRDATQGSKSASDAQKDAAEAAVKNAEVAVQLAELELKQLSEPPDAAAVRAAQANVASATAALQNLQANDTTAELAEATASVARARAELERLQALPHADEIAIAQVGVEQARLALAQAQRGLEQATLRAPAEGVILKLSASVGLLVSPAAPIAMLAEPAQPEVIAQVHELHIGQIAVGQPVHITLDAYPGQTFVGTVAEVAPTASMAGASVSYAVKIALSPEAAAPAIIRPGMLARLEVTLATAPDALWVPRGALHVRGGEWFVRVQRGGRATEQAVSLGLRDGRRVQVLDGLQEGEQVLLNTLPVGPSAAEIMPSPSLP